jgi:NADH dehydrogenase [ubiquinone] 1 alpha subcomplex assembly factor 1
VARRNYGMIFQRKKMLILQLALFALLGCGDSQANLDSMIYNFSKESQADDWYALNDGVMGGVSNSTIVINDDGFGLFSGNVSTANNGGFASIRYSFDEKAINGKTKISLRVKGDSKNYHYSYILTFKTTNEWETVDVILSDMYPSFRGRKLPMSNFESSSIEEISILISNKKNERFELLIDTIELT